MKLEDKELLDNIKLLNQYKGIVNIMEVCGTHTVAISKSGLRQALPTNINLIAGPGCPVCVTPDIYLDYVYELALKDDIIIVTYGDMIRVPGSQPEHTLEKAKSRGAEVKIVYSSIDALQIAKQNPNKKVVFLGIGFETTAPATAIAIIEAEKLNIDNFYIISMHKIVEPVMRALLEDEELSIDGFICPGHVAVIIGEKGFKFLEKYNSIGVIAGFEPGNIAKALVEIIHSKETSDYVLKNVYSKLVRKEGNLIAKGIINKVFKIENDIWRGLGLIENSGLKLREEYDRFNIESIFPVNYGSNEKNKACQCGDVLKGKIRPNQCKLFGETCTPDYPIGPCMVSGEGSCAAYYRYNF